MEVYSTEEEQIAAIKRWWAKYGTLFTVTLLIGALLFTGWRFYQSKLETHREAASALFAQIISLAPAEDPEAQAKQARLSSTLQATYQNTPYARWALLLEAREKILAGALSEGSALLDKARADLNPSDPMYPIIASRLARVLIAQEKSDEALSVLNRIEAEAFLPLVNSIKGDAYLRLDQRAQAREAYLSALFAVPPESAEAFILSIKVDDLAVLEKEEAA